ncbi:hypothetical protein, partial [Rhodovibrio sodomensis]|uniref:hypothetical protein n=1 Tax=Rhodovibrio sodomensis TaxID=1088 RepID=UPI001A918875
ILRQVQPDHGNLRHGCLLLEWRFSVHPFWHTDAAGGGVHPIAYSSGMIKGNGVKWTLMVREPGESTIRRVYDEFVHKVEGDSNNASNLEGADGAVSFD